MPRVVVVVRCWIEHVFSPNVESDLCSGPLRKFPFGPVLQPDRTIGRRHLDQVTTIESPPPGSKDSSACTTIRGFLYRCWGLPALYCIPFVGHGIIRRRLPKILWGNAKCIRSDRPRAVSQCSIATCGSTALMEWGRWGHLSLSIPSPSIHPFRTC